MASRSVATAANSAYACVRARACAGDDSRKKHGRNALVAVSIVCPANLSVVATAVRGMLRLLCRLHCVRYLPYYLYLPATTATAVV